MSWSATAGADICHATAQQEIIQGHRPRNNDTIPSCGVLKILLASPDNSEWRAPNRQTACDQLIEHGLANWLANLVGQRRGSAPHTIFVAERRQIHSSALLGVSGVKLDKILDADFWDQIELCLNEVHVLLFGLEDFAK